MKDFLIASLLLILIISGSCDDRIDVDLPFSESVLVVDAWIDNLPGEQRIFLSRSRPFFDTLLPQFVNGASVQVIDDQGDVFDFEERDPGEYVWTPPTPEETFGEIGRDYTLNVEINGDEFQAFSSMNDVPEVDSITLKLEIEEDFFPDTSYFAEFFARDLLGSGDSYWIRAFKNGQYLNKPSEINVAFDAGFSEGGNIDGLIFIPPIRDGINPEEENPEDDNEFLSPFQPGDSVFVELRSITNEVFDFLVEVRTQTDRPGGFSEIFAVPLANVPSNIVPLQNPDQQVLGMFSVMAVNGLGNRFGDDDIRISD
ncbi:MAG: DUF4249 domain-containing protein [Bacteroidota bacterium]